MARQRPVGPFQGGPPGEGYVFLHDPHAVCAFGQEVLDAVDVRHQETPQQVRVPVGKGPGGHQQVGHEVDLADLDDLDAHPLRLRRHPGDQRGPLDDVAIDGGRPLGRIADGDHLHVLHRVQSRASQGHPRNQVGLPAEARHPHLLALELHQVIDVGNHAETVVLRVPVGPDEHEVRAFADRLQGRQHVLGDHEDVRAQKGLHPAGGRPLDMDRAGVEAVLGEQVRVPGDPGHHGPHAEAGEGDPHRSSGFGRRSRGNERQRPDDRSRKRAWQPVPHDPLPRRGPIPTLLSSVRHCGELRSPNGGKLRFPPPLRGRVREGGSPCHIDASPTPPLPVPPPQGGRGRYAVNSCPHQGRNGQQGLRALTAAARARRAGR